MGGGRGGHGDSQRYSVCPQECEAARKRPLPNIRPKYNPFEGEPGVRSGPSTDLRAYTERDDV